MDNRKTYLFVCRANVDRSRAAEDLCRRIAQGKGLAIDAVSAETAVRQGDDPDPQREGDRHHAQAALRGGDGQDAE